MTSDLWFGPFHLHTKAQRRKRKFEKKKSPVSNYMYFIPQQPHHGAEITHKGEHAKSTERSKGRTEPEPRAELTVPSVKVPSLQPSDLVFKAGSRNTKEASESRSRASFLPKHHRNLLTPTLVSRTQDHRHRTRGAARAKTVPSCLFFISFFLVYDSSLV